MNDERQAKKILKLLLQRATGNTAQFLPQLEKYLLKKLLKLRTQTSSTQSFLKKLYGKESTRQAYKKNPKEMGFETAEEPRTKLATITLNR